MTQTLQTSDDGPGRRPSLAQDRDSDLFAGVAWAALALAFLMPGHYLPWDTFQSQAMAVLAIALLALAWVARPGSARGQAPWTPRALPAPAVLLLLLGGLVLVQRWSGQLHFASDVWMPVGLLAALALAVTLGALHGANTRETAMRSWLWAVAIAALVSAVLTWVQWLNTPWQLDVPQIWVPLVAPGAARFANLGQANHLGLLLVWGLWALWALRRTGALGSTAFAIGVLLLLSGVAHTMSRSAAAMAALSIGIGWALTPNAPGRSAALTADRIPSAAKRSAKALLGAAGVAAALVAAMAAWAPIERHWAAARPDAATAAAHAAAAKTAAERLDAGARPLIWASAWAGVQRAPWRGWGINQISAAQMAAADDVAPVHRPFDSAHNLGLDLALWFGVPVALGLTAAAGVWLWRRRPLSWAAAERAPAATAAYACVLALLLLASVEAPLAHAHLTLPAAWLIGWLHGGRAEVPSLRDAGALKRTPVWRVGVGLAGLCAAAAVLLLTPDYLRAEAALQNTRLASALGGEAALRPQEPVPDRPWLDALVALQQMIQSPARAAMSPAELAQLAHTVQRYPWPPALMRWAVAAGLNGRPEDAAAALRALCAMHAPARCAEAHEGWAAARQAQPALQTVPWPPTAR